MATQTLINYSVVITDGSGNTHTFPAPAGTLLIRAFRNGDRSVEYTDPATKTIKMLDLRGCCASLEATREDTEVECAPCNLDLCPASVEPTTEDGNTADEGGAGVAADGGK